MNYYDKRLRNSDINWPCSIRVVANKVYDTTWPVLKRILRDQGRFSGKGYSFVTTDEYKQYEHFTDDGRGYKYDLKFFDGLIVTDDIIERAKQQRRDDEKYEKEEKNRWAKKIQEEYAESTRQSRITTSASRKQKSLLDAILGLFK